MRVLIKFIFGGLINTSITYFIFLALNFFVTYWLAYSAAFIIGVVISFVINRNFVFNEDSGLKSFAVLLTFYLGLLAYNNGILYVLVSKIPLPEEIAVILVIALNVPISFLFIRRIMSISDHAKD